MKTYNGQGVAAIGVVKSHHAIIYCGRPDQAPCQKQTERPRRLSSGHLESGVLPQAIRVIPYDKSATLDPMSRVDYADVTEFENQVPNIRIFGKVHEDSLAAMFYQYQSVWSTIQADHVNAISPSAGQTIPAIPATITSQGLAGTGSGPITDEQMTTMLKAGQNYAQRNGLTWPTEVLNEQQIRALARNSRSRALYFQRIKKSWQQEDSDDDNADDESDEEEEEEEESVDGEEGTKFREADDNDDVSHTVQIMGTQTNTGSAVGVQGMVGTGAASPSRDQTHARQQAGTQTNVRGAFGVQGIISTGAASSLRDQTHARQEALSGEVGHLERGAIWRD